MKYIFSFFFFSFFLTNAYAITIEKQLQDPKLEAIADEIFPEIRCMVCSGESIADSRAKLAGDMRALVREKVSEGKSKNDILEYLTLTYGEQILMRPPVNKTTYLLWSGPFILLFIGFIIFFRRMFYK